jgi:hypothetical protein
VPVCASDGGSSIALWPDSALEAFLADCTGPCFDCPFLAFCFDFSPTVNDDPRAIEIEGDPPFNCEIDGEQYAGKVVKSWSILPRGVPFMT